MIYKTFSDYLKENFGTKVYKLSLSAGCTCPNRDGTVGWGGCAFCSQEGSGDFATDFESIDLQIDKAKSFVEKKFPKSISPKDRRYIAYFQSFTNTYGDFDKLCSIYTAALERPEIVALSVGTRPDCLPQKMVDYLASLNKKKKVWVELGLQTIHERTASAMNRCYTLDVFENAYARLKKSEIPVVVHVILGLPGESRDDMLKTVDYLSKLNPTLDGIKLQLLHVIQGTALAEMYKKNPFPLPTLEEYCALIGDCLKILPRNTVVHRITGDGAKKNLIAPLWSADKKKVLNTIKNYLEKLEC